MAYKQNNPFSRKTSSPLNHGTHRNPRGGHEGHGDGEEWVTTGTQEGLTGNDIVTSGTRQYTVPGSEQAGTRVGYQESYDKLTDEQRVTYPTVGDWETYVKGYNQEQQAQTFEETRNRDVKIKKPTANVYRWRGSDWTWDQFKVWNNKQGGGKRARENRNDFLRMNNIKLVPPGSKTRTKSGSQRITPYTYDTREIN